MAQHARIEELSDSDPSDMDPSDYAPVPMPSTKSLPTRPAPTSSSDMSSFLQSLGGNAPLPRQAPFSPTSNTLTGDGSGGAAQPDPSRYKTWTCLYPVYFDKTRSRAQGRRVSSRLAVENPLAGEIVEAVSRATGLQVFFEPSKTHPKDWANPGRVKVRLKESGSNKVVNKHHLYILVGQYLQNHPTTQDMQLKVPVPGLPHKTVPPPAVPKGWKMGSILPLHSPALTGGGVSENMFKDMMAEMQDQQQGGGGSGGMPGFALPPGFGADGGAAPGGTGSDAAGSKSSKAAKKDKKKGR